MGSGLEIPIPALCDVIDFDAICLALVKFKPVSMDYIVF